MPHKRELLPTGERILRGVEILCRADERVVRRWVERRHPSLEERWLVELMTRVDISAREFGWDIFHALDMEPTVRAYVREARQWLTAFQCWDYRAECGLALGGDVAVLRARQTTYGDSWYRRGGVGAYMVGIRKWDRMRVQMDTHGGLLRALEAQLWDPAGVLDDLLDLRRYMYLWQAGARCGLR